MCGKVSIQLVLMVAGPIQGSGSAPRGWAPLDGQHFSSPPLPSLFPSGFRTVTNLDEHPLPWYHLCPWSPSSAPLSTHTHSLWEACCQTVSLRFLLHSFLVGGHPRTTSSYDPYSASSPLILLEQLLDPGQLLHLRVWSQTVLPASSHPG